MTGSRQYVILCFMDSQEKSHPGRYKNHRHKLEAAGHLYWGARNLKEAYLRTLHPDWTDDQIKTEVKKWMLYARS